MSAEEAQNDSQDKNEFIELKKALDELEASDPVLRVALELEDIFAETSSEDRRGHRIVKGVDKDGNKVEIVSSRIYDPRKELTLQYSIFAGDELEQQALLLISGKDKPTVNEVGPKVDYKIIEDGGLISSEDPEEQLIEFSALLDWVRSDFVLTDDFIDTDELDVNDLDEQTKFIESATDSLDRLFEGFEIQTDETGGISLGGLDKEGNEYKVRLNIEENIDEEKKLATNTKRSRTYAIIQNLDSENEQHYRLEVYEDLFGRLRYELEGAELGNDKKENQNIFLGKVRQISETVALLPYSSDEI